MTGILLAYLVGWGLSFIGPNSWRWMFAAAAVPRWRSSSPCFLFPRARVGCEKERVVEALKMLTRLAGAGDGEAATQRSGDDRRGDGLAGQLLQPGLRRALLIAVALAVLQQITGINTIIFYGSIIFKEQAGAQSESSAIWANVIIGAINLAGTIAALFLIDTLGRKSLLMIASAGMGFSLAALGILMHVRASATTPILILRIHEAVPLLARDDEVDVLEPREIVLRRAGRALEAVRDLGQRERLVLGEDRRGSP